MTPQPKTQEFEGSSVDDAIKRAVKSMGVSRENMTIKVVCEGQKGLFGMPGASLARIKVLKKEKKT